MSWETVALKTLRFQAGKLEKEDLSILMKFLLNNINFILGRAQSFISVMADLCQVSSFCSYLNRNFFDGISMTLHNVFL